MRDDGGLDLLPPSVVVKSC